MWQSHLNRSHSYYTTVIHSGEPHNEESSDLVMLLFLRTSLNKRVLDKKLNIHATTSENCLQVPAKAEHMQIL